MLDATSQSVLCGRGRIGAFWLGCALVTAGVLLHVPMLLMARATGFRLAGMPIEPGMIWGMAAIVVGVLVAGFGLLPPPGSRRPAVLMPIVAAHDAPLTAAHGRLMAVLVVALVIDVMKPASLGFVVPGMIDEYGVTPRTAAWVPFAALVGTVAGSLIWGVLADMFGRRASILLSSVLFVGTSICGAMPSLWWNVAMCLLMGAAAGGLLPVAYALLAETMPARHRSWSLVLVGGLGGAGGYLAASLASAGLQPLFGWRVLWLLNLPTGLVLIVLSGMIPESAKFLLRAGRSEAAYQVMRRFGCVLVPPGAGPLPRSPVPLPVPPRLIGTTLALSTAALAWGLINFGLLLWLPADLAARGYSIALSSRLLASSALIALPTVFIAAALCSRWSIKWALVASLGVSAAGLVGLLVLQAGGGFNPVPPIALLLIGSNGLLAILLPYAAESYPLAIRGRATGWVAGCTKFGGLLAQGLSLAAAVPAAGGAVLMVLAPTIVAMGLIARFGPETDDGELDTLDATRARSA